MISIVNISKFFLLYIFDTYSLKRIAHPAV